MVRVFNERNFRILDFLSLVFALAIWQFDIDRSMINIMIGLVLPSVLLVWTRWHKFDERVGSFALFAILFAILNWPLGFEVLFERSPIFFIALVAVFLLRPTIEMITGLLFSFWISFVLVFLTRYLNSWLDVFSATILDDIATFAFSSEGMYALITNYWWIYFVVGYLCALLSFMIYEPRINNRFLVIGGILSFPVLIVVFPFSGIIYGIFSSVRVYLYQLVNHAGSAIHQGDEEQQPAKKSYLFQKAFRDWKTIVQAGIKGNIGSSKLFIQKVKSHKRYYGWITWVYSSLFWMSVSLIQITIGTLWITLASLVHIMTIIIAGLPLYIVSAIIWGLDKGYRKVNKVQVLCPTCHHSAEMPIYVCSNCSAEHTKLIPGAYGILKRKCSCGDKLPTTFFNGRANLEARCPSCKSNQHSRESTPISIPIIGGPSVGKTCFMISATRRIIEDVAPKQQWNVRFMNEHERMNFESVSSDLIKGNLPSKTVNGELSAFNFFISKKKWPAAKMVYFYDPAGETFGDMHSLKSHKYYEHNHGNVFIIDPFSIAEISRQYEMEHNYFSTVNPSGASLEEIYDRLIVYFQEQYGVKPHQKITKPIAFVINKVDAYNLDQRIGEKAAQEIMDKDPSIKTKEDAIHQLCYKLLSEAGMNSFLRKVENKFSNYRFFASSTIKGGEFTSVEKPILWVLSQADNDLLVSWKGDEPSGQN
ncbi:TRAFAC clade GTPase domain-containing protein [Peribacillus sp. JNUCC 23]